MAYTEYCNPQILSIFNRFIENKHCILFNITGDIDNLGLYVAKNGRARAEVTVDMYNTVIGNYLTDWQNENSGNDVHICYIPSGEEISVLGITTDYDVIENLFWGLKHDIISHIRSLPFINWAEGNISFGCSIIKREDIHTQIELLFRHIKSGAELKAIEEYVQLLVKIRRITSIELDKEKFRTLNKNTQYPVVYRNFVYYKMLQNKEDTAALLSQLSEKMSGIEDTIVSWNGITSHYGLNEKKRFFIDELVGFLKNGKNGKSKEK